MNNWFNIRADHDGNPELLIEGFIGFWPVVAEEFRWQLNQYDEAAPIEVRIDSMGGDPLTAKSIYAMLVQRQGEVTIVIENNCLSAATIIACAGDKVIMHDLGVYMIHEPEIWPDEWMREDDAQSVVDQVRITREQMVDIYASFTGTGQEEIEDMMKRTTWMNASEALEAGFITEIKNVVPEIEEGTELEMAARAFAIPKRFLNNNGRDKSPDQNTNPKKTGLLAMEKPNWLKRLANSLGLGDESDEADVIISAKELKKQKDALDTEVKQLKDELETVTQDRDDLKEKLDAKTADEEEELEDELETTLEAAVEDYKIKAADKADLKAEYEGDLAGLKKLLARIPEGTHKAKGGKQVNSPKTNGSRLVASGSINDQVAKDLGVN